MITLVNVSNSTCVRSGAELAQPLKHKGQETLGRSFPCLQEAHEVDVYADTAEVLLADNVSLV